jgi:hypothetical protein
MFAFALVSIFFFALSWFLFAIIAYSVIYGSIIFSYYFLWDEQTRRSACPKGLWHTILYDE